MDITSILQRALQLNASDIFFIAGLPLTYKVSGRQRREGEPLKPEDTRALVEDIYALCGRNPERVAARAMPTMISPSPSRRWAASAPMCCTSAARWRPCCA